MKYFSLFFLSFFLSRCIQENPQSFSSYRQIEEQNRTIVKSISHYTVRMENAMALPQTMSRAKKFHERLFKARFESSKLCEWINIRMREILKENNISYTENRAESFSNFDISERNNTFDKNASFNESDLLFHELEKLANELSVIVMRRDIDRDKIEYLNRPEYPDSLNLPSYIGYYPDFTHLKIFEQLLIPIYDSNGKFNEEEIFSDRSVVGTLEELNLIRQRILKACEYTAMEICNQFDRPQLYINKIETVVFTSMNENELILNVGVMTYDSTEAPLIRVSIDKAPFIETRKNKIRIPKGTKNIRGSIGIREFGVVTWRPWEYNIK